MLKVLQVLSENGRQAIRLPEEIHLPGTEVTISQSQQDGAITLTPVDQRTEEERKQGWDEFLKRAAEIPQEEWDLFDAALKDSRTCPKCGA